MPTASKSIVVRPYKVTVVVVAYNGASFISKCIDSLASSALKLNVIVVDNHSTDATRTVVGSYVGVELVSSAKNLGFGMGCNIGISIALEQGADYVLLLNQDAQIAPDTVEILLNGMQEHPETGIASPLQFTGDGKTLDEVFLRHYMAIYGAQVISDAMRGASQACYTVEYTPAAAWLVSRRCLLEVGGFDPLFFMYGEDDDMSRRAAHHGFKSAVMPAAHFFHLRALYAQDSPKLPWQRIQKRASRMRATLVTEAKRPDGSPIKNFYQAAISQFFSAVAGLFAHLDWIPLVASVLAIARTLLEFPLILRHRKIGQSKGTHWLDTNGHPTKEIFGGDT